jgi:hypothetical protein
MCGGGLQVEREEAEIVSQLQKNALALVSSGESYDVFLCCKETDAGGGHRSKDSVIARELRQELAQNGLKPSSPA